MPATVTFITGRAGSGKSSLLRGMIKNTVENKAQDKKRVFLIVPEQFTFETEKELSGDFGAGLLGLGVYSFTTLSEYITEQAGIKKVFLSPQGRRMLIRRAIHKNASKLTAFASVSSKSGFAEKCDEIFELCSRFLISPQALTLASESLSDDVLLSQKLHDLSLLYTFCDDTLKSRGISSRDIYDAVIEAMPASPLAGADVFIDGFDLMTEQLYGMIGKMAEVCDSLTISVRTDLSPSCRDRHIFFAEDLALKRITDEVKMRGSHIKTITLRSNNQRVSTEALAHLEREIFAYPSQVFNGEVNGINIFTATNRTSEAEAAADAVLSAAKSGMRFRDMAIIATDMNSYSLPVQRALRSRNIPCFTDIKHPLSSYCASRFILYSLRACMNSFSKNDVLEVLKSDMLDIDLTDAELFENYVIRFGIRNMMFTKPFEREGFEKEEQVRSKLIEKLLSLRNSLAQSRTFAQKVEVLYSYMEESGVFEYQEKLTESLLSAGRKEAANENAQVLDMLVRLLSQLHEIMADEEVSTAEFTAMFEEGLSSFEISSIPATADQILFGSVGRTRARSLKAVFVLGATEGNFPHSTPDDSIIDDRELARLSEFNITPWFSSYNETLVAMTDVYSILTKPRELLYLSFPITAGSEQPMPCLIIDKLYSIFPEIKTDTDINALEDSELRTRYSPSKEGAFASLIKRLRHFADTSKYDGTAAYLYSLFYNSDEYKERLEQAESALYTQSSPEPFGRELSLELYGKNPHGSASRLETFNECPFKHFSRYGLKILPRKEYKELQVDEGSFCHDALDMFIKRILGLEKDIKDITQEDASTLLADILPILLKEHNNGLLLSSAKNRALAKRLCVTVKDTAFAVLAQLKSGRFMPIGTEIVFGDTEDALFPPIRLDIGGGKYYKISGKIDRVDKAEIDGTDSYRVIDYKGSSSASFKLSNIYHGLSLQLPLYIHAVVCAQKAARMAGFYYQTYRVKTLDFTEDKDALQRELEKQFRLKGLTLDETEVTLSSGDSISSRASKATHGEFEKITRFALSKATNTAKQIFDGEASVSPMSYNARQNACTYCDYASICRFDQAFKGCKFRNAYTLTREQFMQEAGGDDGEMDS